MALVWSDDWQARMRQMLKTQTDAEFVPMFRRAALVSGLLFRAEKHPDRSKEHVF